MKEEIIIDTEVLNANKSEQQLEDIAKATNKADEAGQEYEETLGDMTKEAEVFGVSINGLSSGFKNSLGAIKNSVKGLNSFKIALASTGIGLLVIALGSLVAWMKTSQEGMNFLEDATSAVGAVISNLTGLLAKLGSALVKVFQGDFSGAMDTAKEGITGFVDGVKDSITSTLALNDAIRQLQIASANFSVIQAVNNQEIAKNKRVIEDVNASTVDRIRLAERNAELIEQNAQAQEDLAFQALENEREAVNIKKKEEGRAEATIAEKERLAELTTAVIEAGTEGNEKVIEFEVKLNELYALRNQELEDAKTATVELGVETVRATDNFTKATKEEEEVFLEAQKAKTKAYFDYQAKKKQADEDALALAQLNAEIEYQMTADLFGALAGLAGQDTAIGQFLAIAQASMNTSVAITQALKAPTMAQRVLGIAFATATGLRAISDIKAEPIPEVKVSTTTPFARGGMITGDSHQARSGGVRILAEGGESVINKRSTRMYKGLLSQINMAGGGIPIMANGGIIPEATGINPFTNLEKAIASTRTVLVLDDLDQAETSKFITKVSTTL